MDYMKILLTDSIKVNEDHLEYYLEQTERTKGYLERDSKELATYEEKVVKARQNIEELRHVLSVLGLSQVEEVE